MEICQKSMNLLNFSTISFTTRNFKLKTKLELFDSQFTCDSTLLLACPMMSYKLIEIIPNSLAKCQSVDLKHVIRFENI